MIDNPLFATFGSDKTKEAEGRWVYPAGDGDKMPAFRLARTGGANKAFAKAQMAALKPHQRLIQANAKNPTPEVLEIIMAAQKSSFIGACLLEWKNVKSVEGTALPFSKENAAMLFTKLPDLYDALFEAANTLSTYQSEDTEDEAKNL